MRLGTPAEEFMLSPNEPHNSARVDGHSEEESARKELALREAMELPYARQMQIRSVLRTIARKAALILGLFAVCALLAGPDVDKRIAVLLFLIGAVAIVCWKGAPDPL
jgi:hypothetical protein